MIRIQQLKLPIPHTEGQLIGKIAKTLGVKPKAVKGYKIRKQSIDARKKDRVSYVYTIDADVGQESHILKKGDRPNVSLASDTPYQFPASGELPLPHRPVVVGSGPAGLFCAYLLAKHGYAPIILERGKCMEERARDVETFWQGNQLSPESNIQFGEGGAGAFSDGKLNTLVKDVKGRCQAALDIFIRHGAPEEIGYQSKPHIGTDLLRGVITDMRRQIEAWGGSFLFQTRMDGLTFRQGRLAGLTCTQKGNPVSIDTGVAILAIGHSARDTFRLLHGEGFAMEAKPFAVGLRVEHPQAMVNESQYGPKFAGKLPAAPYKLTANLPNGRGVYSFCMCPGGYVVNASSEPGRVAVNGMSYSSRDGANANSAIIVTVTPEDFGASGPLGGVEFQQKLEEKAYQIGKGRVPQQLFGDFEEGRVSASYGGFPSAIRGQKGFGPLHTLFPAGISDSFCQGMHQFSKKIPGFCRPDAILSGVESRTSSPVRIIRDAQFESSKRGVYPCGEGAGYAGGIMSAAMDGMKVAEAVAGKYRPPAP